MEHLVRIESSSSHVSADDEQRARDAAEEVLRQLGITTSAAARHCYQHWIALVEKGDESQHTHAWGLAWSKAQIALTASWARQDNDILCDVVPCLPGEEG